MHIYNSYNTETVRNTATVRAAANNVNKKVILKNCAPSTSSRISNTQIDDAQYIDVVIPKYNLIECSNSYLKISGILWEYCRDVPPVNDDGAITEYTEANATTDSFSLKGQTGNNGTKNVEIMLLLKYLSNFWRTLEIPLINCEITLDLNWSENCAIVATTAL